MYYCQKCGKELADDEVYCANCGTKRSDVPDRKDERPPRDRAEREAETLRDTSGYNENSTQNGGKHISKVLIVVLVLAVAAAAGGYALYSHNQKVADAGKAPETESSSSAGSTVTAQTQTGNGNASGTQASAENSQNSTQSGTAAGQTGSSSTGSKASTGSKTSTEQAKKHEYTVVARMTTWEEAKSWCESQGGYLATVTSQSEYDTILQKANESGLKVLWLGGSRNQAGNFAWSDGEAFTFSAWAQGEPNNDGGSENYLGMLLSNDSWSMYDMPDDVSAYYKPDIVGFVMEKEVAQ